MSRPWLLALVVVALLVVAWSNSFHAPFELDDEPSIVANPTLRSLGSLAWFHPPGHRGETVGGRPVLNLTFAVNYATGGLDVRGFHATNLLVHVCATLALFGLVRRTLALPSIDGRMRESATAIAFFVATIWSLHPLHTQAVTYIVQRAESLMGLCYLMTLYAFVRGCADEAKDPRAPARSPRGWMLLAWVTCLLGMGVKENMVSAPVAVLLFDRAFVSGTIAAALRRRPLFYLALGATWFWLAFLVSSTGGNRGGSAGFDVGVGWGAYVLTQGPAIVRYLALSAWPYPLVFEYGPLTSSPGAVAGAVVAVSVVIALTTWAVWRRPQAGCVAAIPFLVLAPTSLVPGTLQVIVEHRMYIPLAGIATLAVVGAARVVGAHHRRLIPGLAVGLAVALGAGTLARNRVYASELALWQDTTLKRPDNPRAHNNLGLALAHVGRVSEAVAEYQRAITLQPAHAFAHANLGNVYLAQASWQSAADHYAAALAADPHLVSARINRGIALTQLGRPAEAVAEYRSALRDDPSAHDARTNLAALLIDTGDRDEALAMLRAVTSAAPQLAPAHFHLGRALETTDATRAEAEYRTAIEIEPRLADAHRALAKLLARRGDRGAEPAYRRALELDPQSAETRFALGTLLAKQQRYGDAIDLFHAALGIDPAHVPARNNLANCQLAMGDYGGAIANYEISLRTRPGDPAVQRNLEIARAMQASKR